MCIIIKVIRCDFLTYKRNIHDNNIKIVLAILV